MLFDELFLKENEKRRVELLKEINFLGEGIHSLNTIQETMNLTYHQIIRILNEIKDDFDRFGFDEDSFIYKTGDIQTTKFLPQVDKYRAYLLQDSPPFNFLLSVLNMEEMSIDEFCKKYDYAQSTVTRRMSKLVGFVRKFGLRFTHNPINIVGDEGKVRMFLYRAIWIGIRGNYWPFQMEIHSQDQYLEEYLIQNGQELITREEVRFGLIISAIRYQQGHVFDVPLRLAEFKEKIPAFKRIENFDCLPFRTEEDRKKEFHQMVLTSTFRKYTIHEKFQFSNTIGIENFYESNDFLARFTREMCEELIEKHKLPVVEEHLEDFMEELLYENYFFYVVPNPYPTTEYFTGIAMENNRNYIYTKEMVRKYYNNNSMKFQRAFKHLDVEFYIDRVGRVLFYYMKKVRQNTQKVHVALFMENDVAFRPRIIAGLQNFRNVELYEYCEENSDQYDLIIYTCSLLKTKKHLTELFHWEYDFNEQHMISIFNKVHQLTIEKQKLEFYV
ncbi:Mga helix-turn-helix domain-containing protein [Pilibacter termitis]|uniref:Mga helix-turn-helix domain-containing protein n=1 Tax=Pilibacter termitis TaxID=263852 RepID=A0A1T4PWT6_9ENTE|nr:helix-turn-helix domain-containing protein [Pilibacter termitis]SJZ95955.1 Mga helix-turn-helix domain-containing protein [Pilibacter termitis]